LLILCEEVGTYVQAALVENQGVFGNQVVNFFNGFEVIDTV